MSKRLELDHEEVEILREFERGELESMRNFEKEKRRLETAAREFLKKDRRINVRWDTHIVVRTAYAGSTVSFRHTLLTTMARVRQPLRFEQP